jgi:26S proteasome regulatory subunit N8
MDVITSVGAAGVQGIEKVVVHPLVLLSIVDNYNRVAKDTQKRVLGVLLGSTFRGRVDITNSYAGKRSLHCSVCVCFLCLLFSTTSSS